MNNLEQGSVNYGMMNNHWHVNNSERGVCSALLAALSFHKQEMTSISAGDFQLSLQNPSHSTHNS